MTLAIDFLDRRDPTVPFFLYLSFHRPHAPHDPPAYAFEQYIGAELPEPPVGDWVEEFAEFRRDFTAEGEHGAQHPDMHRRAVAGYYGNITHIDNQINRFLEALSDHLSDREEGYVADGELVAGRPARVAASWVTARR